STSSTVVGSICWSSTTRAGFARRDAVSTLQEITDDDERRLDPRGRADLACAQGLADSGRASPGGSLPRSIVIRSGTAGVLQRRIAVRAPMVIPRGRDTGCQ